MKIIIEQKDVGKEFNLTSLAEILINNTTDERWNNNDDYLPLKSPVLDEISMKSREWEKNKNLYYGKTPSGAPVIIKKERKKPGPKPKIKEPTSLKTRKKPDPNKAKPQPLPESSDVNPLTGEPYVRRGFTIDTPVTVIPVDTKEQFDKKLQSL